MSISSASSHQELACQPFGEHDATRGVLNASLLGAFFWLTVVGACYWALL